MTPEIGFVLILMLLWGPTALWLVYRAARGPRGRSVGFVDAAAAWEDRPQPAADPAGPTERAGEGWVCATCYSVNRPRASRCYACGATPKSGAVAKPAEAPTAYPGVAVMATAAPAARPAMDRPMPRVPAAAMPVAAKAVARTPVPEAAPGTPMPAMPAAVAPAPAIAAAAVPTAVAGVARTSTSPTTPVTPLPPPPAAVAPAPVMPPAAPDAARTARGVPVIAPQACPFLGFKDDPSTRCDFPDARNVCHAGAPKGATREARLRRIGSGWTAASRSQVVDAAHQASHCLTPGHSRCPRYPGAGPSEAG